MSAMPWKDLLTGVSVLISAAALFYAWRKDQLLKKREASDRVRRGAAIVTLKLERWKELALRFFDELQPTITDTDMLLVEKQQVVPLRDSWWRAAVAIRAESTRKILDEQIELAYAELYGYDSSVRELFTKAVTHLRRIDDVTYAELMIRTQRDVLNLKQDEGQISSAVLGNRLRETCADVMQKLSIQFDQVLSPFRAEMLKLITATDSDLFAKRINLAKWQTVFPAESSATDTDTWMKAFEGLLDREIDRHLCPVVGVMRTGMTFRWPYLDGECADDLVIRSLHPPAEENNHAAPSRREKD